MNPTVSIVAVGSELLDGRVQDTNSSYLCRELHARGFEVTRIFSCADKLDDIVAVLKSACAAGTAVILTGGIGPTADDLSREAVAEFQNVKLELDSPTLEALHELYRARRRPFDPSNTKQATFPQGAHIIANPTGTAAGFWVETRGAGGSQGMLIVLPGVPREVELMCEESVFKLLSARYAFAQAAHRAVMRLFGMAEAPIGSKVSKLGLEKRMKVSYRALSAEVQLVLECADAKTLQEAVAKVKESLGNSYIFSEDLDRGLDKVVHDLLIEKKLTLALAESCTAGLLGSMLVRNPGTSKYLMGGALAYSNEAKCTVLGVSTDTIEKFGAVSEAVAREMAIGAKRVFGTDLALSITGIAGPEGGTAEKPIGTFVLGLAMKESVHAQVCFHASTRRAVQQYSAAKALDLLRRHLLGLPLQES